MLDIGGQLCIEMCMITTDLVMHVKKQMINKSKSCKIGQKFSKRTIYKMGTWFCGAN